MTTFFKTCFLLLATSQMVASEFRIISLEPNKKVGMFAACNQVIGQLYAHENHLYPEVTGFCVDFGTFGLYYDPSHGPNWWSYYFEPISVGIKEGSKLVFPSVGQYFEAFRLRKSIAHSEASHLVNKYVRVKEPILNKVHSITKEWFEGFFVIGVHYRGTDKEKEAPRVEYEEVFGSILKHIPSDQPYRIFVATDEIPFLEATLERFPGHVLARDAHRSDGHIGVHFLELNKYALGEEALIDCLLLSKTQLLIRTSSNLSLWATYFNPEMPEILLNRRYMATFEEE